MRRFKVENIDENSFRIKRKDFELVGSPGICLVMSELESGNYDCDCHGKVVLDVGGFQGESAVFFSKMGANKVIIYEPVTANLPFIKENAQLNHVNVEIHEEGVGEKDGFVAVPYEEDTDNNPFSIVGSSRFGIISRKGAHELEIKVRNAVDVIDKSGADVAKFDCEGSEKYLIDVPTKTLRKIEYYIIEAHSSEIKKHLLQKFQDSRFSLVKGNETSEEVSTVHFKRNEPVIIISDLAFEPPQVIRSH
jgi:FkbM family methyltransferase